MEATYSQKASDFTNAIIADIYKELAKGKFEKEINYNLCRVEILNNDFSTIWVKWGRHNCEFTDLPITAMATIADNILR